MNWQSEWELRARMVAVLLLLVALLAGFLLALYWAVTDVLSWVLTALLSGNVVIGPDLGAAIVAGFVLLALGLEFVPGDDGIVAPERTTADVEALDARVRRLAQQADVPAPTVVVSDTRVPNAYTEGLFPGRETIVVAPALVETLDGDELDAVLAHELAHVKNRDVPVITAASSVEIIGQWFLDLFEGDENDPVRRWRARDADDTAIVAFLFVFHLVVIQPIAWAFWFVGRALVRILSQYREYAADRGAVAITGNPAALASALRKLDAATADLPSTDLRTREKSRRAFYIVPVPEKSGDGADEGFDVDDYTGFAVNGDERGRVMEVSESVDEFQSGVNQRSSLPTHPPTGKRVSRLRELQKDL